MQRIRFLNDKKIEDLRAEATARYTEMLQKLMNEGKYRDAAYVQSRIDKINGLEILNIKTTFEGNSFIDAFKQVINEKQGGKNEKD